MSDGGLRSGGVLQIGDYRPLFGRWGALFSAARGFSDFMHLASRIDEGVPGFGARLRLSYGCGLLGDHMREKREQQTNFR